MPRLVLINPGSRHFRLTQQGFKIQTLHLAYLAAFTPSDWEKSNSPLVISPKGRERAELYRKFLEFTRSNYSTTRIWQRTLRTLAYSRSPKRSALVCSFNRSPARRFRTGMFAVGEPARDKPSASGSGTA